MRRFVFAATVSAAALLAGTSLAQTVPELRVGATVEGVLDDDDQTRGVEDDQYRYEDYTIAARRGQRLEAVLRSDDFDAYLQVFAPGQEGPDGTVLAEDDDGLGDDTHARLRFVAPADGTYTLRARTLSGVEGGDFILSLTQRAAPPRAPRPTGIGVGETVKGALTDRDPVTDDDEEGRYDAYVFRAAAGQRYAIALNSDDFDPSVSVGTMVGGSFVESVSNDDGAGKGLNSYLVFTPPGAGEYVIRATPLGSEGTGDYTLALTEAPPAPVPSPIEIGGKVEGELTDDDGIDDSGAQSDSYSFTATAGQRIDATLNAEDFDAYLKLYDAAGTLIGEDDDSGEKGTNSRLIVTLEDGGTYTLQVSAIDETTGTYGLALAEAAPEPEPVPLPFGDVTQGEIKTDSARDDEGRGYVAYTFRGEKGHRIRIVMKSGDFDTYLQVSKAGTFEALSSDDDGLEEGTNSRLDYVLPETGDYVIRASPLDGDGKGLFSIELTDKGPQPEPGSILIGATARGTLTDNDAIDEKGVFFDAYAIQAAEGDKLDVTLVSNDFDAYLDIGCDVDGTWKSVVSDDDNLADTQARVQWTVEDAGKYIIRARSFGSDETGAYALTVERQSVPVSAEGSLKAHDPVDDMPVITLSQHGEGC